MNQQANASMDAMEQRDARYLCLSDCVRACGRIYVCIYLYIYNLKKWGDA